jgi:hypothetical protein
MNPYVRYLTVVLFAAAATLVQQHILSAQVAPCPPEEIIEFIGTLERNQTSQPHSINLLPCQTVVVQMSGNVPPHVDSEANVTVSIRNGAGTSLATRHLSCKASCSNQIPAINSTAGNGKLPGYIGAEALAKDVVISATYFNWRAIPPMTYKLLVTKSPRPNYNIGGTQFSNAPALTGLPSTVFASVHNFENNGQTWKVRLQPGETLTMPGIAESAAYSSLLVIKLYDSAQVEKKVMVAVTPGGRKAFSSQTYTHTSAGAADYYVRATSGSYPTHDLVLTIGTAPQSCTAAPIEKKGFRPGTSVTYGFIGTWGPERACLESALAQWSHANAGTGLNVTFGPVASGASPAVTLYKTTLPPNIAGGNTEPTVDADGYLTGVGILFSPNTDILESCTGFLKVMLHELGHTNGLDDAYNGNQTTVMNQLNGKDDSGNNLPIVVTSCDANGAYAAQNHP